MISELKKEIEKIAIENNLLKELLTIFSKNGNSNKLSPGCKAKIISGTGIIKEGRVIKYNSRRAQWMIRLDEDSGEFGYPLDQIEIFYPGPDGLIDKKHWFNVVRMQEISEILKNSDLPSYFNDKELVNIKVVKKIDLVNEYCFIDFEVFNYAPALRIKIPTAYTELGTYLQLKIVNNDISEIHSISKERYQNQE